jgi:hypothetical protein
LVKNTHKGSFARPALSCGPASKSSVGNQLNDLMSGIRFNKREEKRGRTEVGRKGGKRQEMEMRR